MALGKATEPRMPMLVVSHLLKMFYPDSVGALLNCNGSQTNRPCELALWQDTYPLLAVAIRLRLGDVAETP